MGKERHHNKEQDDDPAGCPQGFLLEKPDPEIRQPGTSLGLTDGEGHLCGIAHSNAFRINGLLIRFPKIFGS